MEKEIKIEDVTMAEKKSRQKLKKEQAKFQPGRIARLKYPGDELPHQNSETSIGSLRKVGNCDSTILVDRFKSLQKRYVVAYQLLRMICNRLKII